jgi:hypothetical protein
MSVCLRLVLEADNPNDLVDVEEGNQIAVENFEAMLDLVKAEL